MTLFLAAVAMGLVVAAWVIVPILFGRLALFSDVAPRDRVDAEARRSVALASLKEVEYDHVSGKLDEEDYRRLKGQLEREALAAIAVADAAGSGAEPLEEARARSMRHRCGFVNPPGSRFCAGCGRRLA